MTEPTLLAGFLLGLVGSTHCVVMCGGVASALNRAAPPGFAQRASAHGLYAVGRLATYAAFGAIAGGFGLAAGQLLGPEHTTQLQAVTRWGVGTLLIVLGIGLTRPKLFRRVEGLGLAIWRRVQPLSGRLGSWPAPARALALGALWGLLPCGMVYGAAAVAAMTGSLAGGALFMTAFGLGTAPAVLGIGGLTAGVWSGLRVRQARRVASIALALCGVWVMVGPSLVRTAAHAHH